jgi:uncharacterized protein (DUF983 family)
MYKCKCPSCGRPAFSWLRKLFVAPALPAICGSCGEKITVSHKAAMLASIPMAIGFSLSSPLLAFVATTIFWIVWVPLEKR